MKRTSRSSRLVSSAARSPALAMTGPELARQDLRERGLAEARRPDEQHVIERFLARLGRLDEDGQVRARLLLADKLGEPLRAQRAVRGVLLAAFGRYQAARGVGHRTILTACAPGCTCSAATRRWRRSPVHLPRAR